MSAEVRQGNPHSGSLHLLNTLDRSAIKHNATAVWHRDHAVATTQATMASHYPFSFRFQMDDTQATQINTPVSK